MLGPGPIGILCGAIARLCGAEVAIVGLENDRARLDVARQYGCEADRRRCDRVGRARSTAWAPTASSMRPAFRPRCRRRSTSCGPAGWISKVGWGPQPVGFSLDRLVQKNVTLQGSFSHNWPIWERVIRLIATGALDVRPITGGVWPLAEWHEAFETMHSGQDRQSGSQSRVDRNSALSGSSERTMRLKDKVILVTGSTTGIGEAIARRVRGRGRPRRDSWPRRRARQGAGRQSSASVPDLCNADLADPAAPPKLVDAAIKAFGRLDGLVNNAASVARSDLHATDAAFFDKMMAVNVRAPLLLIRAAYPHLKAIAGLRAQHRFDQRLLRARATCWRTASRRAR